MVGGGRRVTRAVSEKLDASHSGSEQPPTPLAGIGGESDARQ